MAVAITWITPANDIGFDGSGNISSTVNIGTAASDRLVVATLHYRSNAFVATPTLGGNSMTLVVRAADTGPTPDVRCDMYKLTVTSGTTATLATSGGLANNAFVANIFTVTGANTTETDTDSNTGSATSISITGLTIPATGQGIVAWDNVVNGACAPTGYTEDADAGATAGSQTATNPCRYEVGHVTTTGTNTLTADGSTANQVIIGAAWDVASAGATYWSRSRQWIDSSFRGHGRTR